MPLKEAQMQSTVDDLPEKKSTCSARQFHCQRLKRNVYRPCPDAVKTAPSSEKPTPKKCTGKFSAPESDDDSAVTSGPHVKKRKLNHDVKPDQFSAPFGNESDLTKSTKPTSAEVAARRAIGVARALALTKSLPFGFMPMSKIGIRKSSLAATTVLLKNAPYEEKTISASEELPGPPTQTQLAELDVEAKVQQRDLSAVEGMNMEKGSWDSASCEGVDDLEIDSSLPGMPTVAQLADLEAAILLHKASANSKGVVKVQQKRWTRCCSRLGKELPGMPTTAQLAQLESANLLNKAMRWPTVGIVMVPDDSVGATNWDAVAALPVPQIAALPIAPLPAPLEAPLGFLSAQQWEDLDTWFNENVGNDGEIGEEVAVVGVFDGDQPVAAPEGQWEQQNVQAELVEECETAVGDQAEKGKEDLFSFLDDILANLPQY
ncbi:hypothetical protein HDU77_007403 [Chytriomyces hyalinus]|nr:hypothetical protein HDU77_007403 [Chytriomyces hyalinus]